MKKRIAPAIVTEMRRRNWGQNILPMSSYDGRLRWGEKSCFLEVARKGIYLGWSTRVEVITVSKVILVYPMYMRVQERARGEKW
jgi:hypothetical protein